MMRRLAGVLLLIVLVMAGRVAVVAQNGSQFRDWTVDALSDAAAIKPQVSCAALIALTGYEFSVTTATIVAASSDAPEYCRVSGIIQPEIRFEVSLPAVWTGRLYMFGNGGFAGEALDQPGRMATTRRALSRGFATAQMNTGHDAASEPLATFAAAPQKFVDYAYRGVHVTVMTARRIIESYYEAAARRSYFDGCSTGGRQGLIAAQRFPDDFDGIVVGAPVLNFSGTMVSYARIQRALAAGPIPGDKLRVIADAVYAKCDAADGVKDGLIDDPRRCAFDPSVDLPRCSTDGETTPCLTSDQIRSVATIYSAVTYKGTELLPGFPVGAEIAAPGPNGAMVSGWIPWFVGAPNAQPIEVVFGETFFKNMAFGRPNASYDWKTFDVDADYEKIRATAAALDATDPDLSRFRARGGKIVSYFGWADPALNPMMGVSYYERVLDRMGGATPDFYRLFMVPGMFHCSGGVGVSTFDAFTPLVRWVEKAVAPQSIVGSRVVGGKTVRARPLCPYPMVAKYKGSGSVDDAANFACAQP